MRCEGCVHSGLNVTGLRGRSCVTQSMMTTVLLMLLMSLVGDMISFVNCYALDPSVRNQLQQ